MSKIQIFESNSQLFSGHSKNHCVVSDVKDTNFWKQFTTSHFVIINKVGCFRCQRYKFLKAIHNKLSPGKWANEVVSDVKDTNFWKQFTTGINLFNLFKRCFRCQRYKFLKAIHNKFRYAASSLRVVSDVKDTNFWKQFTTRV